MSSNLLEETRKDVKSCLVAVGGKSTIELLEKDYEQLTYTKIPHYKLGYCSTEAFLRSLTDLVHVTGNSRSALVILLQTKDSKSQHIQNLVAVQRPNKRYQQKLMRSVTNTNYSNRSNYSRSRGHNAQPPRLRHNVRPQQNVNQSMHQGILYHPGQQLQFFGNREPLIQSYNAFHMVPTQVLGNMAATFNNNILTPHSSTSAWMNNNHLSRPALLPTPETPKLPTLQQVQNTMGQREIVNKVTPINPNPQPTKMISPAMKPPSPKVKSPPPVKKVSPIKKLPSPKATKISSPQKTLDANENTVKTPQVHTNHSPARQIPSQRILDEFDDPWIGEGASNVAPPPGYCGSSPSIPEGPLNEPPVSVRIESEDEFTERVNALDEQIKKWNFTTMSTCVMASSGTLPESDEFIDDEPTTEMEPALPDWVYKDVQLVPKDMASYNDDIRINPSTNILKIKAWTTIAVTDMHNPHKFFFQTGSDMEEVDELMKALEKFYNRESNIKLTPKPYDIHPNLCVAALYGGQWHRARVITDTFQKDRRTVCRVHYVDYGTVAIVAVDDVRYLHKNFLEKPQLCHRGSLSGILPYGNSWSCEISRSFLAHVTHREVLAMAEAYYAPDRSWHVELIDPKTEPYVNINMYLIENQMAKIYDSEDLQDYMDFYKAHRPT